MKKPISFIYRNRFKFSELERIFAICGYILATKGTRDIPEDDYLQLMSNVQRMIDLFSDLIDDAPYIPTSWKI